MQSDFTQTKPVNHTWDKGCRLQCLLFNGVCIQEDTFVYQHTEAGNLKAPGKAKKLLLHFLTHYSSFFFKSSKYCSL